MSGATPSDETPVSHAATLVPSQFGRPAYLWCDCRRRFETIPNHPEGPESDGSWERHVKDERAAGRSVN